MKKTSKAKGVVETLLVIALISIIPLFFVIRTAANQGPAKKTPTPPTPTVVATNENAVAKGKQPPACTFPLAQTTSDETTPENYIFSEPQVVLTISSTVSDNLGWLPEIQPDIIEWLPDSQNALIMPSKLVDLATNGYQQTIEVFNPDTKEINIYAIRRRIEQAPPAWSPAINAILYPDMNVLKDSTGSNFKFTRQLRISYGNPDNTYLLADDLPQYGMAVKPDGSQIAYLAEKQLVIFDASLNLVSKIAFDRKALDFKRKNSDNLDVVIYKMLWRPNSSQIFLYNRAPDNLGYTYIMDSSNGQLCVLDFGGWADTARWSPDGRYLAIVRAKGHIPIDSADAAVLDTATGMLYALDAVGAEKDEEHFVQDIAWSQDNRHLLFTVATVYSETTFTYEGILYLGDFLAGQVARVFPSYKFNVHAGTMNLAWSPDNSKILMNCPTPEGVAQMCLIFVQTSGQ